MNYDLIGLGVASLDLIGVSTGEPQLGLKQPLADWVEMGGGPVATALAAFARLGGRACMAGAVGDDAYGGRILADLRAAGVDPAGVQMRAGRSHVAFVLAEPGQDRRTVFWHNDPAIFAGVELAPELIASARALLIDTHMPEAALAAARQMRAAGGLVMIDAERVRPSTLELLPLCDYMVVSARFGREASGETEPAAASALLHSRYGGVAIVTCGADGSWCAAGGAPFHTPAFPVTPVDTTGCGDVFHGGLLFALLRGDGLPIALRFASACAALKCRGLGGRGALPAREEVEALLSRSL